MLIVVGKVCSDVLDVGCGYVELLLVFVVDGYIVVGIDFMFIVVVVVIKVVEECGLIMVSFV